MIKHHSSICEYIVNNSEMFENKPYDCLLNGKKIEFKETVIKNEKFDKYKYASFVVSNKDLISDFMIFINHSDEIYTLIERDSFNLICKNLKDNYTRISERKIIKESIISTNSVIELKKRLFKEVGLGEEILS